MSVCYVTAFLDIERENWQNFRRTFDDYFRDFTPLIDMFKNYNNYHLVVFIDKKHSERVRQYVNSLKNITIVDIDEEYLQTNSVLWQRLPRETEIMNSDAYKKIVSHRLAFPENTNPRYTLINHAKIDFVNLAAKMVTDQYFCWVDFGYFSKLENIPKRPLDIDRLDKTKINYTLINPISILDSNVLYTLQNAPEKLGGFFFFGNRERMAEYQTLFHLVHESFQKNNIADDDQHLALQCYFAKPDLFALHSVGGWHKALVAFQQQDLTTIMNHNGSDKGSGHHNYTIYYSKLFDPIREEKLDLLEFGIGSVNPYIPSNMCGTPGGYKPGSSLRGWKEYFPNAHIYGCDIDKDILFQEDRISTFYADQTNRQVLQDQIVKKDQMYDIIVDDGLHNFTVNWFVLKEIFSKLKENGYYIIEDICNFDQSVYKDPFLSEIEFKYIQIPNPLNTSDNNIVVARRKGKPIQELAFDN
jgi:hypothetical protein